MNSFFRRLLSGALVLLGTVQATYSAVTVLRHYRLGDDDPGAAHGTIVTNSVDSVSGSILTITAGPVTYSSEVAAGNTDSSLSFQYSGVQSASAAAIAHLTNNFGMEAWIKPDLEGSCVVYNGATGQNGFGFVQSGMMFEAFFGLGYFGTTVGEVDTWSHLALVRDGGIATFYLNGIPVGSSSATPNSATGSLSCRTRPAFAGSTTYRANIDEVRIFTFAPGQFSISDLLHPGPHTTTPPVLRFNRSNENLVLTWFTNPPSVLETSTNLSLTNWSALSATKVENGSFSLTNAITSTNQFYRLKR